MRADIVIPAEPRDTRGKNEARRLRARGMAPAIVYGAGGDPVAVAVSPKEINKILHSGTGSNTIFDIDLSGSRTPVIIVDWQYDPIRSNLLHLDLQRVDMNRTMHVRIPVVFTGEPKGVKEQGGHFEVVNREVEISCLPGDIPDKFEVDVKPFTIGMSVRAGDLPVSGTVKLLTPTETILSHVIAMRGEATAEAGTPGAAATAEPEVIKKGKKEEEGGDEKGGKKK